MKQRIKEWFIEGVLRTILTGKETLRFKMAKMEINRRLDMSEAQEVKKWWQSKTILVNALTVIAGGLTFLMSPDAKLDAQQVGTLGSILAAINVVLRMITTKAVEK